MHTERSPATAQIRTSGVLAYCKHARRRAAWATPRASDEGYHTAVVQPVIMGHFRIEGPSPIEVSSGGRVVHRPSRRGNRQLNHAIHRVAICQIRQTHSEGMAYFEKKVAEEKSKEDAIRSLERQISNTVFRHLVLDAQDEGAREDMRERLVACVTGSAP